MKLSSAADLKVLVLARTKWVRHCWLCDFSENLIDIVQLQTKRLGMTYFGAVLVVEQMMLVKVCILIS